MRARSDCAQCVEGTLAMHARQEKLLTEYALASPGERTGHSDPVICFSEEIHRIIYTTNAIESVNMTLRKVTRNHRIFSSDEAVYKVVYLAMRNIARKQTMPIHDWKPALNRLAAEFAKWSPN